MYSKNLLITDALPAIADQKFLQLRQDIVEGVKLDTEADPYTRFVAQAHEYFSSSKRNTLANLTKLKYVDIIMGCNHFIDNLIMKYTVNGIQIVEHDYKYYQRLNPNIKFAQIGNLKPGQPMLIAAPIPGYLNLHPQWHELLAECTEKHIELHIDASWLGAATDIEIDLSHECIQSIATSLSKGLGLHWNRVGLRWSKQLDETDSIRILNKFNMIPESLIRNGLVALHEIPVDYLWNTYEQQHKDICRDLYLRPSKIIHAATSIDRRQLFGLANYFAN